MVNIYSYMRHTSKQVSSHIQQYLQEYSPNGRIMDSNMHLSITRMQGHKGKGYGLGRKTTHDRPQLLSTFGRSTFNCICSDDWMKIVPFLASAEILLNSTYLIDDIVDKQEKRFNDDTTWKKFGVNEAIFAAFRLREIAGEIIHDKLDVAPDKKNDLEKLIAQIHRETYEGQTINDSLVGQYTHEAYMKRCLCFGGVFIGSMAKGISILGNTNSDQKRVLAEIGENYGIAVMIRNDLKDYLPMKTIENRLSSSKSLKRVTMEDIRIGRITYPLHVALSVSSNEDKDILTSARGKSVLSSIEEDMILRIMLKSEAFKETISLIDSYVSKAISLTSQIPKNESRDMLTTLMQSTNNAKIYAQLMQDYVK